MKTTELVDVEHALQLIERALTSGGSQGEFLVQRPAIGGAASLVQQQLATRKTLSAASNLLIVASRLMAQPNRAPDRDTAAQIKAAIERLKVAARSAYEAGHLLVGLKKIPPENRADH